jgi:hypothetical protein
VIADVFVIVKVNVFVWELNSQTTVAVENWPESTPVTVIVSARTVALAAASTNSAASEKTNLPYRDMGSSLNLPYVHSPAASAPSANGGEDLRGNCKSHSGLCVREILEACSPIVNH